MTEDMVVFALQLRATRTLLGWRQSELAVKSGLAQPTIARLERANMMPRMSTVTRLRSVFKEHGVEVIDNLPQGGFTLQINPQAVSAALQIMQASDGEKEANRSPEKQVEEK